MGRGADLSTFHAFEYNATYLNSQPGFLAVTVYRSPKLSASSSFNIILRFDIDHSHKL